MQIKKNIELCYESIIKLGYIKIAIMAVDNQKFETHVLWFVSTGYFSSVSNCVDLRSWALIKFLQVRMHLKGTTEFSLFPRKYKYIVLVIATLQNQFSTHFPKPNWALNRVLLGAILTQPLTQILT